MDQWKLSNGLVAVLLLAWILSMSAYVDAASHKRNESGAKGRSDTGTQWKAHPEKGWVRANEESQFRKGKKEPSKGDNTRRNNGSRLRKGIKDEH
jgi:hypothetical protein